jgi:RES domain-containing protein
MARIVPFASLAAKLPPNWLSTSGKRNRFNPREVHCLYMSADENIARLEFARPLVGLPTRRQPVVTFWAKVGLGHVLDLTDPTILSLLSLSQNDLDAPWHTVGGLTKTQTLGRSVARASSIVAIRYPSVAAKEAGIVGVNVVIFRERVVAPDSVRILGSDKKPLQNWP